MSPPYGCYLCLTGINEFHPSDIHEGDSQLSVIQEIEDSSGISSLCVMGLFGSHLCFLNNFFLFGFVGFGCCRFLHHITLIVCRHTLVGLAERSVIRVHYAFEEWFGESLNASGQEP